MIVSCQWSVSILVDYVIYVILVAFSQLNRPCLDVHTPKEGPLTCSDLNGYQCKRVVLGETSIYVKYLTSPPPFFKEPEIFCN